MGHLEKLLPASSLFNVRVMPGLHAYAHLKYRFTTNIREALLIVKSLMSICLLSLKNGLADVTISAVEPERNIYLFWLPFIKVIYILHSEPHQAMTPFTTFTCKNRLSKRNKIVTVSNSMKTIIIAQWKINQKKAGFVVVIYNCITIPGIQLNIEFPTDKLIVITLGQVDERKNPETWIKVAGIITDNHQNIEFLWLGSGPLLEHYQQATLHNPLISFIGPVNNPHVYLQHSTIYYQPSIVEPHGIAVIEAMYNSLPCIVSNIGGLPESVKNHYNGLVVHPKTVSEHADAIERLINNPEERKLYGQHSFLRYQELFTYDCFKSKMDEIYLGKTA